MTLSKQAYPLVIAITGASGAIYGVTLLQMLQKAEIPTHLVISSAGERTLRHELSINSTDLNELVTHIHSPKDIGAAIASGSFRTSGMIIAPCSVKTFSEIATGITSNLISRAADVMLKERKKLVLMVRETPLHLGHLQSLCRLSEMGAIIAPPVPAFYTQPTCLDDIVFHSCARILDLFDIETPNVKRWSGQG